MISLTIEGLPELTQRFQRVAAEAKQAMLAAVHAEAERILEASYPLVPVDTGALLASGRVLDREDGAEIRYGVPGLVDYAVWIHENTALNHPNGGQHHYLSAVAFTAANDMAQRLSEDIRQRLRRL